MLAVTEGQGSSSLFGLWRSAVKRRQLSDWNVSCASFQSSLLLIFLQMCRNMRKEWLDSYWKVKCLVTETQDSFSGISGFLFPFCFCFFFSAEYFDFVQSEVKHILCFNDTQFVVFCVLSKNRRMFEVGGDLLSSSRPTPPAQAGSATAGCPGPCPFPS